MSWTSARVRVNDTAIQRRTRGSAAEWANYCGPATRVVMTSTTGPAPAV